MQVCHSLDSERVVHLGLTSNCLLNVVEPMRGIYLMLNVKFFCTQPLKKKRARIVMPQETGYIPLRKALKDYLKEQGTTLSDILGIMDEEKKGIIEALRERIQLTEEQSRVLERTLSSRDLNLLLFVIQAFYLLNPTGLYKGLVIEPTRDEVVWGNKVTYEGCRNVLKALLITTHNLGA